MAVAVFNYQAFVVRYPEFSAVSPTRLTAFFAEAGLYLNNTDCSPVQDITQRGLLLNMLTAHIAALAGALDAAGVSPPVGQILSATEGSVSASFANVAAAGTPAWYTSTQYGMAYWGATSYLRGFRYRPRPTVVPGAGYGFRRRF